MKSRDGYVAVLIVAIVFVLIVVGGILWVHYYLPHIRAQESTDHRAVSSQGGNAPASPTTTEVIAALQSLLKQPYYEKLLNELPAAHTLQPLSPSASTTVSYFGYNITAPWKDVATTKSKGNPAALISITFANGKGFVIMKGPAMNTDTIQKWSAQSSSLTSEYAITLAALNTVPGDVLSSTPPEEATLDAALLNQKLLWEAIPPPYYIFHTDFVEGYQQGNATTTDGTPIDVFNTQGIPLYTLIVRGTQPEIDYVLASIKPAS